ncbi:thymocyte nuclear protein 1 [Ananas comosus]|uniref:Thymocyte nuclear protein 1 n=1 Tax=Ananas comosus TaxID=4615 RepID=A0A6P5FFB9_ANACO|nr:thymocyte nuclear protein 1 [Ananas comosus]XP_020091950.1 thymocyte nuclear protein 1 [Ananas comosus]
MGKQRRRYWLLKTEPSEWSWEEQVSSSGGVAAWDGVRNRQAVKHMMSMRAGDRCFFYHSGRRPSERRIVGVVEVARPWYADGAEGGAVDVRAVGEMRRPVELRDIREKAAGEAKEIMKGFALLRQPRLSVVPVPDDVWEVLCEMAGGFEEEAPAPTAAEESSDEEDEASPGKEGE